MKNYDITDEKDINNLFGTIRSLIERSRNRVYRAVNVEMLFLYWNIGRMIVEEQGGATRAKYGDYLIEKVAARLKEEFGDGFSARNLKRMRLFYTCYPIPQTSSAEFKGSSPIGTTLSSQLTWSHYVELIKIKDKNKRNFYTRECINSGWSVRELQRQRTTLLYERLVSGKNEEEIRKLSIKGQEISKNKDIIKDPFVLEFLDIKETTDYQETGLEKNILNHLKEFLLELGKGFTFVGNQVRLTVDSEHFYPDLVFYNRILSCFVIIDLKLGKVTHKDIGQMQMYVNYYDREVKSDNENKTIGILLSTDKNETVVRYTLPEDNQTIFSSEFRLTIPTEKELIKVVEDEKKNMILIRNS
ncbi:DUF1016 family protein [Candidatus Saccharibacteria bacterium]|nr:DUF1016 family protein [Candidatus Saccharibacteria bacterium]